MASNELDLTSPSFDPQQAFMPSSDVILPYPNARIYSNLAEFESRVLKGRRPLRHAAKKDADEKKSLPSTDENKNADEPPVPTTSAQQKQNVLLRMKTAFSKGPLNVLNKCVQQRIRVKVSIRNFGEIRGTCAGFIVAFDKHWNLAMRDVDETYIKRKTLKTPVLKMLPNECYKIIEMCESSEETVTQTSISACSQEDSKFDDSVGNFSADDPTIKVAESDSDTSSALTSENFNIKHVDKIVGKETSELSLVQASNLLEDSVTRLNIEESETRSDEKFGSTPEVVDEKLESPAEAVDLESREGISISVKEVTELSVVPAKETPETKNQVVLAHHRRKRKQPKICQRHVNQLFVRGDNVVFIKLLP